MRDSQILSTFLEMPAPLLPAEPARALVFDACHVGVILRAVLFVEGVLAIAAMFGAADPIDWWWRLSFLSGAGLPATLAWLIAACSLKKVLARLPAPSQQLA